MEGQAASRLTPSHALLVLSAALGYAAMVCAAVRPNAAGVRNVSQTAGLGRMYGLTEYAGAVPGRLSAAEWDAAHLPAILELAIITTAAGSGSCITGNL